MHTFTFIRMLFTKSVFCFEKHKVSRCVEILCVAALTNGTLARQKGQSRPLYKSAQSTICQIILLQRWGTSLRWLCWKLKKERKSRGKKHCPGSDDSLRPSGAWRSDFKSKFPKEHSARCCKCHAARMTGTVSTSHVGAVPMQRLRFLMAHAPITLSSPISFLF